MMQKQKLFFLILILLALFSCKRQEQQSRPSPKPKTMKIALSDVTSENAYSAVLKGRQFVELRPQVSGVITDILISEGARVTKGQTLFVIDQVPYIAALKTAQANVLTAPTRLETSALALSSSKDLLDEDVVSEYDFKLAMNNYKEAQAAYDLAKAQELTAENNLSYTEVKSPVDGLSGMISYHIGALVNNSITIPLVTVSDNSSIYAYFSLSEQEFRKFSLGKHSLEDYSELQMILGDDSIYENKGRIDAISGNVDVATGSISIRSIFPNPNGILRSGGSAQVLVSEVNKNAIRIPKTATFQMQNMIFVHKIIDGKNMPTAIKVADISLAKDYVVLSGLMEGDEIIAEGAGLIR